MTQNADEHPAWAVDQGIVLLAALAICTTHSEMLNSVCLKLRQAYHRGARDAIKDIMAREALGERSAAAAEGGDR